MRVHCSLQLEARVSMLVAFAKIEVEVCGAPAPLPGCRPRRWRGDGPLRTTSTIAKGAHFETRINGGGVAEDSTRILRPKSRGNC